MSKICIIGNNANGENISDGGRIKIRMYQKHLIDEGHDVFLIDLCGWKKHIVRILRQISKCLKTCDSVVIMAGPNGCRFIIPIVVKLNRKYKTRVVYCPLGTGVLEKVTKKLSIEDTTSFLKCNNFYGLSDNKMQKFLSRLNLIIPQNEMLVKVYKTFYNLHNVLLVPNFRDGEPVVNRNYNIQNPLKLVFFSRVTENKGILDLINVVNKINHKRKMLSLDIYGSLDLQKENQLIFQNNLNEWISYKGVCKSSESISTLANYNLFCLPTKYSGEGTPGSLIEAKLAGTPALVSSYSQSNEVVEEGKTGFIFEINNIVSLENKLMNILSDASILRLMSRNVIDESFKYLYEHNKRSFIEAILG